MRYAFVEERKQIWLSLNTDSKRVAEKKAPAAREELLQSWERFHNFARPHGAHNGKTPYEALGDN